MPHYTALVTLLAIAVYFWTGLKVGKARQEFGVVAPAITGHTDFERVFRAQQNTLEWMPIFLPLLWLFAIYVGDIYAAGLGLIWVVGRVIYVLGYSEAADKRGIGFAIQGLAAAALLLGSIAGIVWRMTHGG
jgi:glutathione S-transferase